MKIIGTKKESFPHLVESSHVDLRVAVLFTTALRDLMGVSGFAENHQSNPLPLKKSHPLNWSIDIFFTFLWQLSTFLKDLTRYSVFPFVKYSFKTVLKICLMYINGPQSEAMLPPREHLAMSGGIFGCHNKRGECRDSTGI